MSRYNRRQMFLPNYPLTVYHGTNPHMAEGVDLYQCIESGKIREFVVIYDEDYDFIKTQEMMFGRELKVTYVWDWFNRIWDNHYDKLHRVPVENYFYGMASTLYNLIRLIEKPQSFDEIRRKEMVRRDHRDRPQPIFICNKPWEFI